MNEMEMMQHVHHNRLWTFPNLAFGMVILTIILSTYWIFFSSGKDVRSFRYNLFNIRFIKSILSKRLTQFLFQLPIFMLFIFFIITGIFGRQLAGGNASTVLTWTFWWAGLIFAIFFFGKIWCYICPWYACANWLKRFHFWKVKKPPVSFEKKWPNVFKNIYLATGFFVLLTWLELGFGVTYNPKMTAYLGILMLFMVILPAFVYKRSSFCRYGCLVGRVSGLYAMFSPIEIRAIDKELCSKGCKTSDCLMGNEKGYPCPTFQYLGQMETNTYCIMCMECIKTCPHDNIGMNVRPFASDLKKTWNVRADEAYLTLIMLSLTIFHGMTMTPVWAAIVEGTMGKFNWEFLPAFTLIMFTVILIPFVIHYMLSKTQDLISKNNNITIKQLFVGFAYPLLPVALVYHLAHNLGHLIMEGKSILRVISDPFGWGWNLFNTALIKITPVLPHMANQQFQVFLLFFGQVYAIKIAVNVVKKYYNKDSERLIILQPALIGLLVFSIFNLWLLFQPMDMRTAM